MSTEYYAVVPRRHKCPTCEMSGGIRKILFGRWSCGHYFQLFVDAKRSSWEHWLQWLQHHRAEIEDEYGNRMPIEGLKELILQNRSIDERPVNKIEQSFVEPGIRNLHRPKLTTSGSVLCLGYHDEHPISYHNRREC